MSWQRTWLTSAISHGTLSGHARVSCRHISVRSPTSSSRRASTRAGYPHVGMRARMILTTVRCAVTSRGRALPSPVVDPPARRLVPTWVRGRGLRRRGSALCPRTAAALLLRSRTTHSAVMRACRAVVSPFARRRLRRGMHIDLRMRAGAARSDDDAAARGSAQLEPGGHFDSAYLIHASVGQSAVPT